MSAIADRRARRTLLGACLAVLLVASASVMFGVGVVTLSNSREGEAVGIDERLRVQFPITPNALLAVQDDLGRLTSLVVMTLLPAGQGGSIVPVPVNADVSLGFGDERRPIDQQFDPADVPALVASVEEMLSISIQRAEVIGSAEFETLVVDPIGSVQVDLPNDVVDTDTASPTTSASGRTDPGTTDPAGEIDPSEPADIAAILPAGTQLLEPSDVVAVLTAIDDSSAVTSHRNDVAVWEALAASAPIVTPPEAVPADDLGRPISPATVEELVERLFQGLVGVRDIALAPNPPRIPPGVDAVILDQRDSALVFAQVSPALVSTPKLGLKIRVVAPFTDEQLGTSSGLFDSTSLLVRDFIGQMLWLQNNVVSVDSAAVGASGVTLIEVVDEQFLEQIELAATAVFGESEVRLATTVLEGVDVQVTLGMSYIVREMVRSDVAPEDPAGPTTTVAVDG